MWEKIRVVFTIPELRQKILITLLFLAIFRLGSNVTLPIVDKVAMQQYYQSQGTNELLEQIATFSATNLHQFTIFGLGIMPYISASIIFQLLASVWGPLERLKKEGASGQKKINEYTRYATVFLAFGQSWAYMGGMLYAGAIYPEYLNPDGTLMFSWKLLMVLTMTAGTMFVMWLGEQVDEYGIGNGISLLIMAGILARLPEALIQLFGPMFQDGQLNLQIGSAGGGSWGIDMILMMIALFVGVVVGVVFITLGVRRIPTQSTKHVRGRRVYGGNRDYLPLRVNQAGVMPIIFASSLLMVPWLVFVWLGRTFNSESMTWFGNLFSRENSFVYNLGYVLLIYFFCFFWTAITFNPKDIADNLKDAGSFIRGHRAGRQTADYIEKVMTRITYVGAGFLSIVAIMPAIISHAVGAPYNLASFYGGTGLLIAVSVAFDLVQKIDSHLVMRDYKGLLEKN
ncbi:MAG: preprotein translocase subunit SecY [Planctomycetia bacterium]|nr:preprotein translocase subunit SecY [Planctomycetia bacterium]